MCVLPFTRYMHIPAEMLLIPFRNAGLTIKHARRGFAKAQVYSCPNCGVCIDACPMSVKKANIKDTTVYLNRNIRRGNEKRIEEISDKCLLCGKCTAVCQVGVDGPQMRIAQRSIRNYGLEQDYSGIDITPFKEAVAAEASPDRVLYFAGCMTALTPAISRAMESVFRKAGVDYAFMDKDGGLCCGRPILMAGRFDQARQIIRKNKEIIKASGASTLVLSCPICYKVFREHYKLEGIRVVHHTEYMLELVKSGRLSPDAGSDVLVFHDPCELGRGSGIYEQPRELLRHTGELVEAEQNRDMSICCGGSLGSLTLGFDKREDLTRNALRNLKAGNPETIVTACPLCKTTFAMYSDVPVEDIAETVNKHLK
jgi:Fe-S oxidoreductase